MLEHCLGKTNPDGVDPRFVLMAGDQIYADMFNRLIPIGLADTFEEFQERYHTAFGSPHMRRLLRQVPTYMILDDHEIEDNWTQDRIEDRQKRVLFNLAIDAYRSYQWSHSSRIYGQRLYYHFECGGYPFFILDGRTQRYKDDDPENLDDNHLLGRPAFPEEEPSQLEILCDWLSTQQQQKGNAPKFIVTASVFVPNNIKTTRGDRQKNASDSWPAFPATRRQLLQRIVDKEIQNVVFLSGDIHCSNVAEIHFDGTVVPKREVTVAAEVGGQIVEKTTRCKAGNYVTEGMLLLRIDPRRYELEVRRLRSIVDQAQIDLKQLEIERANNLPGSIP